MGTRGEGGRIGGAELAHCVIRRHFRAAEFVRYALCKTNDKLQNGVNSMQHAQRNDTRLRLYEYTHVISTEFNLFEFRYTVSNIKKSTTCRKTEFLRAFSTISFSIYA
ncbi:hypothetical protein EVAR_52749_1 [Eumeta japonica]|uniref:Uncharacterized protein n=1 Tax=Eumeta variegata TaxID=151549 RepID=A0A4C1XBI5_EUMVA|nr:hypothetical protein EVAR_52749_1 [Eumeta japonica]